MSQNKTFWILFSLFLVFLTFYLVDFYFLGLFRVGDIWVLQGLFVLSGLGFVIYMVHCHGYLEGYEDAKKEMKENGKTETESDRSLS